MNWRLILLTFVACAQAFYPSHQNCRVIRAMPFSRKTLSADRDLERQIGSQSSSTKAADAMTSELPNTFEDSISDIVEDVDLALREGIKWLRVDFDASQGDETYSSFQRSLPVAKHMICELAPKLEGNGTMRVLLPDEGSAAMVKRDWGANEGQVPANVAFNGIRGMSLRSGDLGCMIVCPSNSETDDVLRIFEELGDSNRFVILLNPELVNMSTTGYGLAGRKIRDVLSKNFSNVYYLKTLPWGAVTQRYTKLFSIWQEDDASEDGYRLIRNTSYMPSGEELAEIYEEENGINNKMAVPSFINGIADFVRDFGRL